MKTITPNAEKDLALVKDLRSENSKKSTLALDELFKKYHNLILFRYRGLVKNEVDAEDLAMEAFTKCYENIEKFNEKDFAFSTWLFSLTRNLFIDSLRKRKTETVSMSDMSVSDDEGHSAVREFEAHDLNPEKALIQAERDASLQNVIDSAFKKKPNLKELIELRYFFELSYNEIQKITGTPLNTIKAHLFRAKAILKEECLKTDVRM